MILNISPRTRGSPDLVVVLVIVNAPCDGWVSPTVPQQLKVPTFRQGSYWKFVAGAVLRAASMLTGAILMLAQCGAPIPVLGAAAIIAGAIGGFVSAKGRR
jgi:hypothetical protein